MITTITPLSDRPEAFYLWQLWLTRQSFLAGQEIQRLSWKETSGHPMERFKIAMLGCLEQAKGDVIFIIEDDDWYHPAYIKSYLEQLKTYDLYGEGASRYYSIRNQTYQVHDLQTQHASFCQTAFRRSLIPLVTELIQEAEHPWFDALLWGTAAQQKSIKSCVTSPTAHCVGIKGMPGSGLAWGHSQKMMYQDTNFEQLRRWIGPDAAVYQHVWEKNFRDDKQTESDLSPDTNGQLSVEPGADLPPH